MKHRYIVTTFIVSISAAAGAGFFGGANYANQRHRKTDAVSQSTNQSAAVASLSPAAGDASSANNASSELDSAKTYLVKKGQTLYSIGKEIGVDWPSLASVNGLDEHSVLKEGQVLKIPTAAEAATSQAREYSVPATDDEKQNLQTAQDYANAGTGQLSYRLVPAQVVQRSPLLARFGFDNNDLYIEKTKDTTKGEASVEVTHQGKLYTVMLNQPLSKGDKGVWTPVKVLY